MPATYEPIASTTLGSATSNITFSSIPGTYTDLVLVLDGSFSVTSNLYVDFNGGAANEYSTTDIRGSGSAVSSGRTSNQMQLRFNQAAITTKATWIIEVMSYTSAMNKTILCRYGSAGAALERSVGLWRQSATLTSIKVYPAGGNLNAGFTASLYGIKSA